MRCQECKTCLSAIRKGHAECVMSFDYRKCKNALIEAAKAKQLGVYNALKRIHWVRSLNPSLSDDWDTLGTQLILNGWYDQYHEMYRPIIEERPSGMEPRRKQHVRNVVNACVKANDLQTLRKYVYARSVVGNDWTPTPFNMSHNGYTVPGSRIMDSYIGENDMMQVMELAIMTKNNEMIKEVYGWFQNRSNHWNTCDFDYAVETGDISVLLQVIELWRNSEEGFRGIGVEMKLATIKESRLDMLKLLDDLFHFDQRGPIHSDSFYPMNMMRELTTSRGKSTPRRKKMISYVSQKLRTINRTYFEQTRERERREVENRRIENERIEQRQATAAPVAPAQERPTNLQKALGLIEECEIQEGKYLEICNLLMDVHRRGVC